MKNYALERRLLATDYQPARKVGGGITFRSFIHSFSALMSIPLAIAMSCMALLRLRLSRLFNLTR